MIPINFIEAWQMQAKWQNALQVEQDLVICRALIDLYNDPYIKDTLIFRGGTAINKLFLNPPARYSEDLDFVQKRPEPIGRTINTLREILKPWLGEPTWKITNRGTKLFYKYKATNDLPAKLKIEINTTEHFQVLPLLTKPLTVNSEWFQGKADITTYELEELMATKLKAVYQRRKGRDLFDLWYLLAKNLLNLEKVIDICKQYCAHEGLVISAKQFTQNLYLKKQNKDFQSDMNLLLPLKVGWNFEEAFTYILEKIPAKLS